MRREFAAALLLGGKSRRMGTDKAMLDWHGRPLWQHQLEKLFALHPAQLLLSTGPYLNRAKLFEETLRFSSNEIVPDVVSDNAVDCGPLGGIVACLERCRFDYLVVLAVDLPRMETALLKRFVDAAFDSKMGQVATIDQHFEPMAAVYPKSALGFAEEQLSKGNLRLQDLNAALVSQYLMICHDINDAERLHFQNWNDQASKPAL